MREWVSANGTVVRQQSCRQDTTMARAGTLPENIYFDELPSVLQQRNNGRDKDQKEINEEDTEYEEQEDEIPEYESKRDAALHKN